MTNVRVALRGWASTPAPTWYYCMEERTVSGLGYIVLRQRGQRYELLDPEGKLIRLVGSVVQALRVAAEAGVPLLRDDGVEMKTAG